MKWTIREITGTNCSRPIRGGAVDSRIVQDGELFVALPGERTDGHAFLADAVARGAAALIVSRPIPDPSSLGDVTIVRFPCSNVDFAVSKILAAKGAIVVRRGDRLRKRLADELQALAARYA